MSVISDQDKGRQLEPAITFNGTLVKSTTDLNDSASIVNSEFKVVSRQVSFRSPIEDASQNDSSEEDLSDTSSQFSFIKDRKGGRNTSVKYYKTAVKPEPTNTFNPQDLGYDHEDLDEYDFENNGLDYDENDYGEEDVNYSQPFDYEDSDKSPTKSDFVGYSDDNTFNDTVEGNFPDRTISNPSVHSSRTGSSSSGSFPITQSPVLNLAGLGLQTTNKQGQVTDFTNINCCETTDDLRNKVDRTNSSYKHEDFSFSNSLSMGPRSPQFGVSQSEIKSDDSTPGIFYPNPLYQRDTLMKPFYLSYHMSVDGFSVSDAESSDSDNYGHDILENYLDLSQLTSTDPPSSFIGRNSPQKLAHSSDYFDLPEVNSPLINGLTIGNNLHHRSGRLAGPHSSSSKIQTSNRAFIHRGDQKSECQTPEMFGNFIGSFSTVHYGPKFFKSFHTSISHNMNLVVSEKVSNFDQFSDAHHLMNDVKPSRTTIKLNSSSQKNNQRTLMTELSISGESSDQDQNLTISNGISTISLTNDDLSTHLKTEPCIQQKRASVLGMMDFLANMESSQVSTTNESTPSLKANRKSVAEMLSALDAIGGLHTFDVNSESKHKSPSPLDLLVLQEEQEDSKNSQRSSESGLKEDTNAIDSTNDANHLCKAGSLSDSNSIDKLNRMDDGLGNGLLDQDIIDEINQLPEDFDFEEHELKFKMASTESLSSFYRSNSYNKKPVRAVVELNFKPNIIETGSKTVTFYRSKSLSVTSSNSKANSVSRTTSLNSTNNISTRKDAEDFSFGTGKKQNIFQKISRQPSLRLSDSTSKVSLSTISERT
jgi:hypothetical protein